MDKRWLCLRKPRKRKKTSHLNQENQINRIQFKLRFSSMTNLTSRFEVSSLTTKLNFLNCIVFAAFGENHLTRAFWTGLILLQNPFLEKEVYGVTFTVQNFVGKAVVGPFFSASPSAGIR